eukprot:CAMPEP_0116576088 /NCGR_PEP_ID=MMETSP0397-20121206/20319_1 /TAXON_ID=216820 /ORGANISM="Cyclophora tenuis, Strain ECT3854" /LENGTH=133 /DNA_ID=CAMNT_0004105053 /DNA_START=299 /DNA_END=700 /DNA_ORIENTATION=-
MRLLTHNYLQSNVRGTDKGYPLLIEPEEVVVEESPLDKELLTNLLPKLNYNVLLAALQQLRSHCQDIPDLPAELPAQQINDDNDNNNEPLLTNLHRVLMDIHVIQGALVCPDTGRRFPIKEGIPNMILHEDEV